MDLLDFQIFRSLGFQPYGSQSRYLNRLDFKPIAKSLGIDGKTVKLRLTRMENLGFIKYYQIYPNYRLLGVKGLAAYLFEVPELSGKYKAIEKIGLIDGIVEIYNFVGNTFCVDFAYRDARDHDKRLSLLKELSRCTSCMKFSEYEERPAGITLSEIDWRIIKSLRYHAFKRLSKVAEELAITAKTVNRRFERMAMNNVIQILPVLNPGKAPDIVTYGMIFFLGEEGRKATVRRILEAFESTCFLMYTPPSGHIMLCNFGRTVGETEDAMLRARSIKGVKDVRLYVLKELREYSEWLDREIERKVVELEHHSK